MGIYKLLSYRFTLDRACFTSFGLDYFLFYNNYVFVICSDVCVCECFCVCICMYMYVYVCICMYMYVYVRIYIHTDLYMYACKSLYVCIHLLYSVICICFALIKCYYIK